MLNENLVSADENLNSFQNFSSWFSPVLCFGVFVNIS
jgi:hypothetical protein